MFWILNVLKIKKAKRNILTRRYVCSQLEAATLAGYQLQMAYGDYNPGKSKVGYLAYDYFHTTS